MPRVLVFGDEYGLPRLLPHLPAGSLIGIVASALRPDCLEGLRVLAGREQVPFAIQPGSGSLAYLDFLRQIRSLDPDFIIVHSYSRRLPSDLLACARQGAVNVHSALLPRYRGPNPVQWAIIAGERETGVTLHHLSQEFDGGDIVAQRALPIAFEDTWRDVYSRLEVATEHLLAETLPALLAGRSTRTPQDSRHACSFPRRRPEDGRIDWRSSVVEIYNLIRALVSPLPGAFYETDGGTVVIDSYLRIPEVLGLKFGKAGSARLESGGTRLTPCGAGDRSGLIAAGLPIPPDDAWESGNGWFAFLVVDRSGQNMGCCGWSVDWSAGSASVTLRWWEERSGRWPEVERLIRRVARDELGLSTVVVDGPSERFVLDLDER